LNNVEKGGIGESFAAKFLTDKGYTLLDLNYTCKTGEIDIIAQMGNRLVFTEVKLRQSKAYGYPRESVGYRKQQKIRRCAMMYIAEKKLHSMDCRFDVIEILKNGETEITHLEDAF